MASQYKRSDFLSQESVVVHNRIGFSESLLEFGPFLRSYSVFVFPLFLVSGPCARLNWPSRQSISARSTVSYCIIFV